MPQEITLASILRFGDIRLEQTSAPVVLSDPELQQDMEKLTTALSLFQKHYRWGRSIAAPQLGILKRLIAIKSPGLPEFMINPKIIWHSQETQVIWDDCMSLPEIAVRVSRWQSVCVSYQTVQGQTAILEKLSPEDSELLQHEIDHLDGIIMSRRMRDSRQVIAREFSSNQGTNQPSQTGF